MLPLVAAFFLAALLPVVTRVHPAAYGCLLPIAAAGIYAVAISLWPSGSMDAVGVPFMFLFVAAGSVPGAFLGGLLRGPEEEGVDDDREGR